MRDRAQCLGLTTHVELGMGGASETLFALAQEDRCVCLFSVLSFTWRLFCLSGVSGDKMT